MDLEYITLSETTQSHKEKKCMFSLICGYQPIVHAYIQVNKCMCDIV